MIPTPTDPKDVFDEPPPVLGSWKRVYVAVVLYLAGIITAFWLFGRGATP